MLKKDNSRPTSLGKVRPRFHGLDLFLQRSPISSRQRRRRGIRACIHRAAAAARRIIVRLQRVRPACTAAFVLAEAQVNPLIHIPDVAQRLRTRIFLAPFCVYKYILAYSSEIN